MSEATTEPLVRLRDVRKDVRLPDHSVLHILRGVDFEVYPREHVGIVGRSGAGKSTLLNILGLLDRPTAGEFVWRGEPLTKLGAARAARIRGRDIGFVFQQFQLLPGRSARENVAAPLLYGSARDLRQRYRRADEMLARLGLAGRGDEMPHRLSGGEQQRVAIARALVRGPKVVLADEPTGALDIETGQLVMQLLEEATRDLDAALITITHDPGIAMMAQRCLRMDQGRLTEETPERRSA